MDSSRPTAAAGGPARLSLEAIRQVGALRTADVQLLARRLYEYPSVPLSSVWRSRLPNTAAVERWLDIDTGGRRRQLLAEHWVKLAEESTPGWLAWRRRYRDREIGRRGPELKLYVSPEPRAAAEAFGFLLEILPFCRARGFKVGADAEGLFRPDKIVAYFSDLGDLALAAHRLAPHVERLPACGVPFTAEITGDGLLSWSVDPPTSLERPFLEAPSWRQWVTSRLAAALVAARGATGDGRVAERLALDSLRREGIDTNRWLPLNATAIGYSR